LNPAESTRGVYAFDCEPNGAEGEQASLELIGGSIHVKLLLAFFILAGTAFGRSPAKIITFIPTDTEHCKVINAGGKPLLQSTYQGTTVSIAMPINRGNGDFSIFVRVSRAGGETIEVNPKYFYGLFSDKNHTRFQFYDRAAEIELDHPTAASTPFSSASATTDSVSTRQRSVGGAAPRGGLVDDDRTPPASDATFTGMFFRKGSIKPGSGIAGWITLRQPKGAKLEIHRNDMLDEIDIQVNGVVFRF
jgi:hypothetical protein